MGLSFLLFFGSIAVFIGIRYFISTRQFRVFRKVAVITFYFFLFLTLIFISTVIMSRDGIYYWGYRSSSWIFIAMTFLGVLFFLMRPDGKSLRPLYLLPFSGTLLCVGLSSLLVFGVLWNYKSDLVYKDDRFRLERTGWFISPCGLPTLFVKNGFLENKYHYITNYCLSKKDIDSIIIDEIHRDTIVVSFYHHSNWDSLPKPIVAFATRGFSNEKLKTQNSTTSAYTSPLQ